MTTRLERGRHAFANREWKEAYRHFSAAEADLPLEPEDLECLAQAAWLSGRDTDAQALFRRVHHVLIDRGQRQRAARWGFWLSLHTLLAGDSAQSTGWLARIQRLVADEPQDAEQGYVGVLSGLRRMAQADAEGARTRFEHAIALAERFGDRDLLAFGLLGRGQALIQSKRVAEGVAQLDEAMVGVTTGEISPMAAGIVYCAVIVTCQRIFDLQRCREWTQALTDWCATQTDLVPFRGECLIHRSEILQLQGEWPDAIVEAERAIEVCSGRAGNLAGRALYQCAELHRLRGAFERAEAMYREAGNRGTEPQPGLSLLRLAQGDIGAAKAAMLRAMSETGHRAGRGGGAAAARVQVLRACIEIMMTADEIAVARTAAGELEAIAAETPAPFLLASSAQATGTVLLAEGNARAALAILRDACTAWQQLDAPYESAQVRALIACACRGLGDKETARSHYEAAARVFDWLGAAPARAELEKCMERPDPIPGIELSSRELQVLGLVAKGQSNRQIAARLFISEHTVAGHLSSIFSKLGVTSRTAAAAFAFQHGIL
ncbi:MAG: response regulator transcription factor [Burkholderiaceae bacterium]|jgi:DNA-binding NarL/FixJ family response regulator|nr:response regulator transcription factor [Burkholderiaceae bacterium]